MGTEAQEGATQGTAARDQAEKGEQTQRMLTRKRGGGGSPQGLQCGVGFECQDDFCCALRLQLVVLKATKVQRGIS